MLAGDCYVQNASCYIFQIPKTADVDSLPLLHGDSVSLHLKASSTVGKSSTSDFFFNDDIEEKTKKLQLMVRKSHCLDR